MIDDEDQLQGKTKKIRPSFWMHWCECENDALFPQLSTVREVKHAKNNRFFCAVATILVAYILHFCSFVAFLFFFSLF